jgi:hypothetical protein
MQSKEFDYYALVTMFLFDEIGWHHGCESFMLNIYTVCIVRGCKNQFGPVCRLKGLVEMPQRTWGQPIKTEGGKAAVWDMPMLFVLWKKLMLEKVSVSQSIFFFDIVWTNGLMYASEASVNVLDNLGGGRGALCPLYNWAIWVEGSYGVCWGWVCLI